MSKQLELPITPRKRVVIITDDEPELTPWYSDGEPPPHSGYWDVEHELDAAGSPDRIWFDSFNQHWVFSSGGIAPHSEQLAWRGLVTPPPAYPYRLDQCLPPVRRTRLEVVL
jgi:hypothetical protein